MPAAMGGGRSSGDDDPDVNVPSFFRCPISLDVMKSPVSLCTGVTYDRSSIQAWLDTGHNTCPATMQVLPTTDFVPNLTLHRLIQHWSTKPASPLTSAAAKPPPHDLLRDLPLSGDPLPLLRKLAQVAGDADVVRGLVENADYVPALNGILVRRDLGLAELEAAVKALSPILLARKENGGEAVTSLADSRTVSSLLAVVKGGSLDAKIAAAWVMEAVAVASVEAKLLIAETEGAVAELLRLVSEEEPTAVDAALSCLVALSSPRRVRPRLVRAGAVTVMGKLLTRPSTPAAAAEKALRLMEAASTCAEGRTAICEDPTVVEAIVGRVTKAPEAAAERAVVVLWSVCHLFRDRRAVEAVAASNGLTKILLLMQSNCSPAARQMSGDLLRIFKVNAKSCLPSYDSKATHITPF